MQNETSKMKKKKPKTKIIPAKYICNGNIIKTQTNEIKYLNAKKSCLLQTSHLHVVIFFCEQSVSLNVSLTQPASWLINFLQLFHRKINVRIPFVSLPFFLSFFSVWFYLLSIVLDNSLFICICWLFISSFLRLI